MSNKTQLQTNNIKYESLIEILKDKAIGGGAAEPVLQEKEVIPSEEEQVVIPDNGFDGLSKVDVQAIPNNYEDVTEETATYTGTLEQLGEAVAELEAAVEVLPESGGSDGGVVLQTGNVTINNSDGFLQGISWTSVSDGEVTPNYIGAQYINQINDLENVLCNSAICLIINDGSGMAKEEITGNIEVVEVVYTNYERISTYSCIGDGTIKIYDNSGAFEFD